jgi:hypothetical protein
MTLPLPQPGTAHLSRSESWLLQTSDCRDSLGEATQGVNSHIVGPPRGSQNQGECNELIKLS